jgi:hypothetical protein
MGEKPLLLVGPRLRQGSLAPALLRGSRCKGPSRPAALTRHPCLVPPYATPTLGRHQSRVSRRLLHLWRRSRSKAFDLLRSSSRRHQSRLGRRPNGGVAEPGSEAGAEPAPMGHGRPFGAARWSDTGMREPRRGRGPARSNAFAYFGRNQSKTAVRAGTNGTGTTPMDMLTIRQTGDEPDLKAKHPEMGSDPLWRRLG